MPDGADSLIVGVVTPPPLAEWVAPLLRFAMKEWRTRDRVLFPNALLDLADRMDFAASVSRESRQVGEDVGAPTNQKTRSVTMKSMEVGTAQAAGILGVTQTRVQKRIKDGDLPARRDENGRYRIRLENLEAS
jgi:hypothetical protein